MDKIMIIKHIVLIVLLIIASYGDLKCRIIQNKLILIMFGIGIILLLISFDINVIVSSALAMTIAAIVFIGTYLFSKGNLGEGDVKLAICTSMYVGLFDFINIMIYALIYTVIVGIGIMVFKRSKDMKLPFAPFVLAGCITNLIFYFRM